MNKYNHFEDYEWFGQFHSPDKEVEFPGKLTYTPENGLILEFICPYQHIKPYSYIHGILSDYAACTLFGKFDSREFGFHIGTNSIFKGKIRFDLIIFGNHFSNNEKFSGFIADFTNFQEFCCPEALRNSTECSNKPLIEYSADNFTISLINQPIFNHVLSNYPNIFHCKNEHVINKINEFFKKLKNDFPDEKILVRKNIEWLIKTIFKTPSLIESIIKQIHSLENLLSLLIYKPVIRDTIYICNIVDKKRRYFPCLISIFDLNKNKIDFVKANILHHVAPINLRNINFDLIIKNWMNSEDRFRLFSSTILSEDRRMYPYEIYSGIILLLTMLESISIKMNTSGKDKYTAPINKYDKTEIMNKLKYYLSAKTNEEIGKLLSDLRAEIVHIGKRRKILSKLSNGELLKIFMCLKVSVASYMYETLGIPSENIKKFQERNLPLD